MCKVMSATLANFSLNLQRQLLKQQNALKATVDTQVSMSNGSAQKVTQEHVTAKCVAFV